MQGFSAGSLLATMRLTDCNTGVTHLPVFGRALESSHAGRSFQCHSSALHERLICSSVFYCLFCTRGCLELDKSPATCTHSNQQQRKSIFLCAMGGLRCSEQNSCIERISRIRQIPYRFHAVSTRIGCIAARSFFLFLSIIFSSL